MISLVLVGTLLLNLIIFSLFFLPFKISSNFSYLVHYNALFNALTLIFIFLGLYCIFNKKIFFHKVFMSLAACSTFIFLLGYVLYHLSTSPVRYSGAYRPFYLFLLITHIVGSFILTPLAQSVLLSAFFKNFKLHKRIARFTYPLWIYTSITGLITYFFLKPFY